MSNAVAVQGNKEVAPLYPPTNFDVDASDIQLPKVYVGHPLSKAVQNKGTDVEAGDIYIAAGAEDPDAEVVWEAAKGGEGVLFQVLRMDRGLSYDAKDGKGLQRWEYGNPNADPEAWTTWTYTIVLPEVDQDLPYKILMTKSNRGTAKRMNMALKLASQRGPIYNIAFRLSSEPKQNDFGKWHAFVVKTAEPTAEGLAVAEAMYDFVQASNDAPDAIVVEEGPAI